MNCTDTGGCTGDCRQGRDCEGSRQRTRNALGIGDESADEVIDLTASFIVGLVFAGFVWGLVDVANDILLHGWTP